MGLPMTGSLPIMRKMGMVLTNIKERSMLESLEMVTSGDKVLLTMVMEMSILASL